MISFLLNLFFHNTIYIRFSAKNIFIRFVEKNRILQDQPIIAIEPDKKGKKVVAVGKEVSKVQQKNHPGISVHNAFEHPRTFVWEFELAEATLRYYIYKIVQRKILIFPTIILHPIEKTEGGITQIERRGLFELGSSIGGKEVYIWTGRNLSDLELTDRDFLKKNSI